MTTGGPSQPAPLPAVSDSANGPASTAPTTLGVVRRWAGLARRRVRERPFWLVQALVLAVTGLHIAAEAWDLHQRTELGGIVELPVVLHIVPVVYAGFRYGYEGSVLTGLWSGVLAVPNILFWHSERYGWLTDLTFIAFVIVLGVVIAVPVERERRQRQLAEAGSRRLITLNRVAAELAATTDLRGGLDRALGHLVADLPLRRVRLETTEPGIGELTARAGPTSHTAGSRRGRDGPGERGEHRERFVVPIAERGDAGSLVAEPGAARPLGSDNRELLAAAARQIGSALEADLLRMRERDRLRTYAREVIRAQERERARIARDLHDVVAQELTLLGRRLDELDEGRIDPDQLRSQTDEILDTVRRVSRGLRPPAIEDLGLVPILRSLANDVGSRTGAVADVRVEGEPRRLAAETELTLYRIVQEAAHNAERHAAASQVDIEVVFGDDHVLVSVTDDGNGFDGGSEPMSLAPDRSGLGLIGMRERADLAGGSLEVRSAPGAGTSVTARLPADRPDR